MRERKIYPALAVISTMLLIGLSTSAGKPQSTQNTEASKLDRRIQELYRAGKYSDAIPIATKVLEIRENALGPDDPATATSLNNLGELYERMGNYAKAEPLLQHALEIREKALGPEHPNTAQSLDNLAGLYSKMGNYAKAEPLYQKVLKIHEKVLGPEQPGTAASL